MEELQFCHEFQVFSLILLKSVSAFHNGSAFTGKIDLLRGFQKSLFLTVSLQAYQAPLQPGCRGTSPPCVNNQEMNR